MPLLTTHRFVIALGFSALAGFAAPATAQEWTQFRGPNGTGLGQGRNLPVEVTEQTTAWKTTLPGTGHSSPVVWGKRLFLTSAEDGKGKRHLHALDADSGKILWTQTHDFVSYRHHKFSSAAASTPVVDAERVYVTWGHQEAMTVTAHTHDGKEVWSRDMGPYLTQHGASPSPVLAGGLLLVRVDSDSPGPDSYVAGLDPRTGEIRWKVPRKGKSASYSVPVVYRPAGGPELVILTSNGEGMTALDPRNGAVAWEFSGIFKQRCVSVPVLSGDIVFATSGDGAGSRQGLGVKVDGKSARMEYQVNRGVPYVPSPVVLGDLMFLWGDGGVVTCVKAATGEQVWMERVGGNYFGSPVCADGKLYALAANGDLVVIAAAAEFKLLGRSPLAATAHSTPAVAHNRLYLRTESTVYCLRNP